MSPDVIGWVAGGVVALLATLFSVVSSRRANRAKAKLDEVAAYSQLVQDLHGEIDRLKEELMELRQLLTGATTDNDELRRRITMLQTTVNRLTDLLRQHQIPLPADV